MSEELVLAVYKDGPIRRFEATEDPREFREALAFVVETLISSDWPHDLRLEAARFATLLRGWLPRNTQRPRAVIVTRVYGEDDDVVLGPMDWRVLEHADGSTTVIVPPELEGRARELWPDVPVERAP